MGVRGLSSYIRYILSTQGQIVQSFDFNERQRRELTFCVDVANFTHGIAYSFCKHWYHGAPDGTFYPSLLELFSQLKKRNIIFHFYLEVSSTKSLDEKEHESFKRSENYWSDMKKLQADLVAEIPTDDLRGKSVLVFSEIVFLLIIKAATVVGFPFSIVNGEGDYAMVELCRQSNVYGVISGDSDFCTFPNSTWILSDSIGGWHKLLRSLQFNKPHKVMYMSNSRLMTNLRVDPIDIAALAGCDMSKVEPNQYLQDNVRGWNSRARVSEKVEFIINHLQRVNGLKKCPQWKAYCDANAEIAENYQEIRNFFESYNNSDGQASTVEVTSVHEIYAAWFEAICKSECVLLPISLFYKGFSTVDSDGNDISKFVSITSLKRNLIFCGSALYRRLYLHENDNYEVFLHGQFEPNEAAQRNPNYEVNPKDYLLPCINSELVTAEISVKITALTKLAVFLASGRLMDNDDENNTGNRLNDLISGVSFSVIPLLLLVPLLSFLAEKTMFSDMKESCNFITMTDLGLLVVLICYRYLSRQQTNFKKEHRPCFDTIFCVHFIRSCFSEFAKIFSLLKINDYHELLSLVDFAALCRFAGHVKSEGMKFSSFNELFQSLMDQSIVFRMVKRDDLWTLSTLVWTAAFGDIEISDQF
ncbi:hypothetical protein P9112_003931 [Eukaryota sp. TZLM1-RC]